MQGSRKTKYFHFSLSFWGGKYWLKWVFVISCGCCRSTVSPMPGFMSSFHSGVLSWARDMPAAAWSPCPHGVCSGLRRPLSVDSPHLFAHFLCVADAEWSARPPSPSAWHWREDVPLFKRHILSASPTAPYYVLRVWRLPLWVALSGCLRSDGGGVCGKDGDRPCPHQPVTQARDGALEVGRASPGLWGILTEGGTVRGTSSCVREVSSSG